MDRGVWWVTIHGVARVGHDLVNNNQTKMNNFPWKSYTALYTVLKLGSEKLPLRIKSKPYFMLSLEVRPASRTSAQRGPTISTRHGKERDLINDNSSISEIKARPDSNTSHQELKSAF